MSNEATRYREQADYCHEQANRATYPQEKQAWLKVAGDWLQMAERDEAPWQARREFKLSRGRALESR